MFYIVRASELSRAIRKFQKMARKNGRLPEAVLYIPKGMEVPPEAYTYFDAVVREGEERLLKEFLKCPYRLTIDEWVEELPRVVDVRKKKPWKNGKIPLYIQKHIDGCKLCRKAFRRALRKKQELDMLLFLTNVDKAPVV